MESTRNWNREIVILSQITATKGIKELLLMILWITYIVMVDRTLDMMRTNETATFCSINVMATLPLTFIVKTVQKKFS